MMEQALTDYVGATILTLPPHFTPVASWHDPGMPAAAIVLDGYRRQITWTPSSGWRYTRLHTGTAAQRGPAYYLDAGPVPAPQVVVDRLRRWQSGGEAWSLTQPSYPPGGVLEALRAAVPDAARLRSCPDCGRWRHVDPGEHARCETCGTDLPQRAALDVDDAGEVERLRAELAEAQRVAAALRASREEIREALLAEEARLLDARALSSGQRNKRYLDAAARRLRALAATLDDQDGDDRGEIENALDGTEATS